MEFIGTHWYIWLLVMIAGFGYAYYTWWNLFRRIRRVEAMPSSGNFFAGIGAMFVAAAIGAAGTMMLNIAVFINIIKFAR